MPVSCRDESSGGMKVVVVVEVVASNFAFYTSCGDEIASGLGMELVVVVVVGVLGAVKVVVYVFFFFSKTCGSVNTGGWVSDGIMVVLALRLNGFRFT